MLTVRAAQDALEFIKALQPIALSKKPGVVSLKFFK
jgi:hypothetical protein